MEIPLEAREFAKESGLGEVVAEEKLQGGLISLTRRLSLSSGSSVILKQCADPPPDLYRLEASGLSELKRENTPRIPEVLCVSSGFLLLEDLRNGVPGPGYWETFGRQVALLHRIQQPRYGFHEDNYLGLILLDNTWSEDGYEFFARTRILNFLHFPKAETLLTAVDRRRVEKLASRLRELVPFQRPSLLHGDLWASNMPCDSLGNPCLIDPAVYFGWPEADLSMAYGYDGVEPSFYDAYREVNALEPGWEKRMDLLNIREFLSMIAHTGNTYNAVAQLRALLDRFV